MNRKGQILIFFVILIPLFAFIAALVIDMGYSYYQSNKLHHLNNMVLKYGLNHINDVNVKSEMISLLYKNDSKIDSYEIIIEGNKITLKIDKTVESVFGKMIKMDFYYISSKYIGYINGNKIIIEKG
ncbi:MAG: pilus assembly protein [Bacilli bacterium]|nr:pilus assembly protein [Bacilli bacterium]MDD4643631.1 pilus assembly protein [Bacilli bacterium]